MNKIINPLSQHWFPRPTPMTITLYGIPNCGSVKKARDWLDGRSVEYRFVDFKKKPPTQEAISEWTKAVGWESLLNRRGTTFRGLPEADKAGIDEAKAEALMLRLPSIIKRPVLDLGEGRYTVGFDPEHWKAMFKEAR